MSKLNRTQKFTKENIAKVAKHKESKNVSLSKIRGLKSFLNDYKNVVKQGYVITMGERKEKLSDNITAIPWFCL